MLYFPLSALVFFQGSTAAIGTDGGTFLWIALVARLLGLVFALFLAKSVLAYDTGTPEMRAISNAIREGAEAFMSHQYTSIAALAVVLAVALFVGYKFSDFTAPLAGKVVISFLIGAICSGFAGYTGMFVSIRTNIRAASAARSSLGQALKIALRGGAVAGMVVISLSLLGVGALFFLFGGLQDPQHVPYQLVGFGFGASLVALFAQLGGGIYTKAADVGADLVGKVEAGIPEDDPRNPAVIADLVGDNVGDCAGRGADLFESTAAENIGAMILGVFLYRYFGVPGILFPLVVGAFGLVASMVGILSVRTAEDGDPMQALNRGFYVTAAMALIFFAIACRWLLAAPLQPAPDAWWHFLLCGVVGLLTSMAILLITQYYTEYAYRPVRAIAEASQTGPATNIIQGLAVGMEATILPVFTIAIAIIASYYLGRTSGLVNDAGEPIGGLFGTAAAAIGMLGTAGCVLAMDTFGPITDNAGGIIEMSQQPESVRAITDRLDAVGNTTKALTKGYAIGSAALAAFLLFSAYLDEVFNYTHHRISVNLARPEVFVAGLLGAMLVFWFTSLAIKAVGRAAYAVINEVRRQFRERPGIMQGTEQPDYARSVDIVTIAALREMIVPGLLVVLFPIAVGLAFKTVGVGAEAVAAFLMIPAITGILMALFFNTGGGAWDNAKKYIETGAHGGKRSEAHKAAVVGDTVGDPFKDTAGPSLHVLIKLLATVTLVLAPLFL